MIGTENANKIYLLCVRAIHQLKKIVDEQSINCDFELKKSLYLASKKSHVSLLEKEFEARKTIGIKLQLLNESQIKKLSGLKASAALYSEDAAQMDPFLFTHELLQKTIDKQCQAFDLTDIKKIKETNSGAVLTCSNGAIIACNKFIFANGYECQSDFKNRITELNTTYAIISKPLSKKIYNT